MAGGGWRTAIKSCPVLSRGTGSYWRARLIPALLVRDGQPPILARLRFRVAYQRQWTEGGLTGAGRGTRRLAASCSTFPSGRLDGGRTVAGRFYRRPGPARGGANLALRHFAPFAVNLELPGQPAKRCRKARTLSGTEAERLGRVQPKSWRISSCMPPEVSKTGLP